MQAGISPVRAEFVGEAYLEIRIDGVGAVLLQDQEVVALGRIFFAGGAGDAAILDRPMIGAARPIALVFAIEKAFEIGLGTVSGEKI